METINLVMTKLKLNCFRDREEVATVVQSEPADIEVMYQGVNLNSDFSYDEIAIKKVVALSSISFHSSAMKCEVAAGADLTKWFSYHEMKSLTERVEQKLREGEPA